MTEARAQRPLAVTIYAAILLALLIAVAMMQAWFLVAVRATPTEYAVLWFPAGALLVSIVGLWLMRWWCLAVAAAVALLLAIDSRESLSSVAPLLAALGPMPIITWIYRRRFSWGKPRALQHAGGDV